MIATAMVSCAKSIADDRPIGGKAEMYTRSEPRRL
jgi:hypothetical protein